MYRVYLDWNVISNLKRTDNEKFCQLKSLISSNRDRLSIPFTTAHIDDLRKSIKPGISHDLLLKDLDLLSEISNNQFINWTENITKPTIGHPNRFYYENIESWTNPELNDISNIFETLISSLNEIGLESFGSTFKSTLQEVSFPDDIGVNKALNIHEEYDNLWDYLNVFAKTMSEMLNKREKYIGVRANIQNNSLKISTDSTEWEAENVIDNIDEILKSFGVQQTFLELNEFVVKQIKKDKSTIYDEFTSLYLMLDMLGYKSDKLKKSSNNMLNIINDGLHSFYGAHCDYLITDDKNLVKKSIAIYSKYRLKTRVLSTDEFVNSFSDLFPEKYKHISKLISDFNILLSQENFVENVVAENGVVSEVFKFEQLVLDYFNYATRTYYSEFETTEIIFAREYQNYSQFLFYNELDNLIRYILYVCEFENVNFKEVEIRNLIFEENKVVLIYDSAVLRIALMRDDYKIKLVFSFNNKAINESQE